MIGSSKSVWGFDPRSVPGCSLWLDGADQSSMTFSGSTITQWNDKSGNGKNATATGTPTYVTGGGVNFNGSSYFLNQTFTMNLSQRSIFIVMQETSRTNYSAPITFIPTPSSDNDELLFTVETINGLKFYGNASGYTSVLGNSTLLVKAIYNDNMNVTTGSGFLNGTNATNVTAGSAAGTSSGYTIGGRWQSGSMSGSYRLNGVIYEIIIFNTPLTTSQRQQVEGYLSHKWGLNGYYDSSIPLSVPGCQLWLDAADASTITGTTSVTAWRDKSGNSNNPTIFGSPNITVGTINNVKAMWFNGTSGTWGAFSNSGATVSGFAVGTMNSGTAGYGRIIGLGNNPGNDAIGSGFCSLLLRKDSTQGLCTRRFDIDYTYSSYTYDTPFLASVIYDGTNGNLYVNGATIVQFGSTGNFGYSNYSVGCGIYSISENTIDTWKGYVGEVILYRNALTTTQRQSIEGYLARKWGFTSMYSALPSIHPFSSIRPHLRTFQPADIPGCQLWLDAADSSTLVLSGSNVTQWSDKSGNGRNGTLFQNYPTYTTNRVNFNGTQGLATSLSPSTNIESGFVICGFTSVSSVNTLIGSFVSENGGRQFRVNNAIQTIKQDIVAVLTSGTSLENNTTYLCEYVNNGTTLTHYLNGNSYASGGSVTYTAGGNITSIGYRSNNNGYNEGLYGYIQEVLIFSTALTTSQRQQVEGYLAHKWGLTTPIPSTHPFKSIPSSSVTFSPRSISGIALWLDGADQSSMTFSGSNITQWNDKSGNGRNATATGTPTYLTGGVNFNASSYFLNQTFSMNLSQRSIFIVMQETTRTTSAGVVSFIPNPSSGNDYSTTTGLAVETASGLRFLGNFTNGGYYLSALGNSSLLVKAIYNDSMNVTTGSGYLNGTNATNVTADYTASTCSGYTIGVRWESGSIASWSRLNGVIYEILVYNTALTTAQRQQVEGYLAQKWGLTTSLPSTHVYKKIPP